MGGREAEGQARTVGKGEPGRQVEVVGQRRVSRSFRAAQRRIRQRVLVKPPRRRRPVASAVQYSGIVCVCQSRRQRLGCSLALHAPQGASRKRDELSKMRQVSFHLWQCLE